MILNPEGASRAWMQHGALALRRACIEAGLDSDLFLHFVVVDSATDYLPLGEVRHRWSHAVPVREDRERSRLEDLYRSDVMAASRKLSSYATALIQSEPRNGT
jgi:hypothetical protein